MLLQNFKFSVVINDANVVASMHDVINAFAFKRYRYTWSKNDVISFVRKHNCALGLGLGLELGLGLGLVLVLELDLELGLG